MRNESTLPLPSHFYSCLFPDSSLLLTILPPDHAAKVDRKHSCSRFIMLSLYHSFLLTPFPCSSIRFLPQDAVLHELFRYGSFPCNTASARKSASAQAADGEIVISVSCLWRVWCQCFWGFFNSWRARFLPCNIGCSRLPYSYY